MANHVGRPTNEEVAARKRKKLIKILLPLVIIGVLTVMIIGNNGLKSLMGASTCVSTCEEGWNLDGNTCYQETTGEATLINAYLVGDVINEQGQYVPDGKTTLQDYNVIKNTIESGAELDETQQLVYDLNGDGVVDTNDVSGYSTSTTGEYQLDNRYVCPKEKVEQTEENGIKTITTTRYELTENNQCSVLVTTRQEKERQCSSGMTGAANSDEDKYSEEDFGDDEDKELYTLQDNETDEDEYYFEYSESGNIIPSQTMDQSIDIDEESGELLDIDGKEELDDDSILNNNSNIKNALASNGNSPTGGGPGIIGYIYLQTINSRSKKSVQNRMHYGIYKTLDDCEKSNGRQNNPDIVLPATSYNLKKQTGNKITYLKITYGLPVIDRKVFNYYIKRMDTIVGYTTASKCKKISSKYIDGMPTSRNSDGRIVTIGQKGYKKFKNRVKISATPITYQIKVGTKSKITFTNANGTRTTKTVNKNTKKTVYYSDLTTIKNIESTKSFAGWTISRTNSKGTNKELYCYSDANKSKKVWASKCGTYGLAVVGTNGKVSFSKINAKSNYILTFTPKWSKISVNLKNGSSLFTKRATVKLYTDKKCSSAKKSRVTRTGKTAFSKVSIGKQYYIKATSSYSTGSSCISAKIKKSQPVLTKNISLPLNRYVVKFVPNGGSGKMSNLNIKKGASVKLTANSFKKTGKKFAYWTASIGAKQYCYANSRKTSGTWNTSCTYGKFHFKNKATIKNLTSAGNLVTMKANWK